MAGHLPDLPVQVGHPQLQGVGHGHAVGLAQDVQGLPQVQIQVLHFCQKYLLDLLDTHYSGKAKTHRKLYTVLSFLIWYQVTAAMRSGHLVMVLPRIFCALGMARATAHTSRSR